MLTKAYCHTVALLESLKKDERGVTAIEYSIVAVAIASIVAAVFASSETAGAGGALQTALEEAIDKITTILTNL